MSTVEFDCGCETERADTLKEVATAMERDLDAEIENQLDIDADAQVA